MEKVPRVGIGALVMSEDGEILLLKSHKWHGRHILPCGHVEFGEKMKDAVKREVKEETGLDVFDIDFLRLDELIFSEEFHDKERHFISVNFKCKTRNKKIMLNDEAESFIWVKPEDALKLNLDILTKSSIRKFIEEE